MRQLWLILTAAVLVTACGGETGNAAEEDNANLEQQEANEEGDVKTTVKKASADEITVNLYTVGEEMTTMTYEPNRIQVPPGAKVTLILMNKAKSEAMIHNAVIIQPGSQQEVIEAGLEAGPDNEYIAESSKIIAYTPLAQPGETVEVTFTAPEKEGTYQYICTYPGHSSMKGIMIVKEK